jgi:hypothetical protein
LKPLSKCRRRARQRGDIVFREVRAGEDEGIKYARRPFVWMNPLVVKIA